jgi:A/G-specific adenine glycosylase
VREHCAGLAQGRVEELPSPRRAPARKQLELVVAVAQRKGRGAGPGKVLLARRVDGGLFGGLWELPSAPGAGTAALKKLLGPRATIGPELVVVERTLTHRDLVMRLHPVELPLKLGEPPAGYAAWKWVDRTSMKDLGLSSATGAALTAALGTA